jgi:uncharacterized membrane protein
MKDSAVNYGSRAILGVLLFLMVILGMIWLIQRDDSRRGSAENAAQRREIVPAEPETNDDEVGLVYTGTGLPIVVRSKRDRYLAYVVIALMSILVCICSR